MYKLSLTLQDILYSAGIIHIIDKALEIPLNIPTTETDAGLSYLVALVSRHGFLSNSEDISFAMDYADTTM